MVLIVQRSADREDLRWTPPLVPLLLLKGCWLYPAKLRSSHHLNRLWCKLAQSTLAAGRRVIQSAAVIKKIGTPAEMKPRLSEIKTMIRLNVIGGAELDNSSSFVSSVIVLASIVPVFTVISTLWAFSSLLSSTCGTSPATLPSRSSLNRLCLFLAMKQIPFSNEKLFDKELSFGKMASSATRNSHAVRKVTSSVRRFEKSTRVLSLIEVYDLTADSCT